MFKHLLNRFLKKKRQKKNKKNESILFYINMPKIHVHNLFSPLIYVVKRRVCLQIPYISSTTCGIHK